MWKGKKVKLARLHFLSLSLRIFYFLSGEQWVWCIFPQWESTHLFSAQFWKFVDLVSYLTWQKLLIMTVAADFLDSQTVYVISCLIFLYKASQIIDLFGLMSWRKLTMKHKPEKVFCSKVKYLFETQPFAFNFQVLSFLNHFKCKLFLKFTVVWNEN